jgi:hypothetical protein
MKKEEKKNKLLIYIYINVASQFYFFVLKQYKFGPSLWTVIFGYDFYLLNMNNYLSRLIKHWAIDI